MLGKLRARISYSNVVATLALFLALGGTGYAVTQLNGKQIKKRSIPGNRLKNDRVGGAQINEGNLGEVPLAANAADADRLGGDGPEAYQRFGRPIPSGVTVTGAFGLYDVEQDNAVSTVSFGLDVVSLPAPAPVPLTDANVNFSTGDPGLTGDEDNGCNGTPQNPMAPRGKVCLYQTVIFAAPNSATGEGLNGTSNGFVVRAVASPLPSSSTVQVTGTWAYTAP